jgi:hypothetical protein
MTAKADSEAGEALFGGFDGLTSVIGVIAAGLAVHARLATIAATSAGLAVASAVSMAGGEFLGDVGVAGRRGRALVMGGATLVGSILPALPYLFLSRDAAGVTAALIVAAMVTVIIVVRSRGECARRAEIPPRKIWVGSAWQTIVILVLAAGLAVGISVVFGDAG